MQGRTVLVAGSLAAAVAAGWGAARHLPFAEPPADDPTPIKEPVRFPDRPLPAQASSPPPVVRERGGDVPEHERIDPEMARAARLLGMPVQHYANARELLSWRPPVYPASGFGDPSHPYPHASSATLKALADAGDGAAAWHLAMRHAARNRRSARDLALKAAVLLDSGEPIILLVENYLADTRSIGEAWAYLLIAREIGVEPVQRIDKWLDMASEADLADSQPALEKLRVQAASFRGERRED